MKRQNRVFKLQVDVQTMVLILQILHLFVISDKSLSVWVVDLTLTISLTHATQSEDNRLSNYCKS